MKQESELIKSFSNEQLMLYHSMIVRKEAFTYVLYVLAILGGIVVGYFGANCT